jgi:hypothetical protein
MSAIDVVLTVCIVATAAAYLAWALLGGRSAPPCHNVPARAKGVAEEANVILGASLQRGLERARAKRR